MVAGEVGDFPGVGRLLGGGAAKKLSVRGCRIHGRKLLGAAALLAAAASN